MLLLINFSFTLSDFFLNCLLVYCRLRLFILYPYIIFLLFMNMCLMLSELPFILMDRWFFLIYVNPFLIENVFYIFVRPLFNKRFWEMSSTIFIAIWSWWRIFSFSKYFRLKNWLSQYFCAFLLLYVSAVYKSWWRSSEVSIFKILLDINCFWVLFFYCVSVTFQRH